MGPTPHRDPWRSLQRFPREMGLPPCGDTWDGGAAMFRPVVDTNTYLGLVHVDTWGLPPHIWGYPPGGEAAPSPPGGRGGSSPVWVLEVTGNHLLFWVQNSSTSPARSPVVSQTDPPSVELSECAQAQSVPPKDRKPRKAKHRTAPEGAADARQAALGQESASRAPDEKGLRVIGQTGTQLLFVLLSIVP